MLETGLTSAGRPRIVELDVVRGFALCGILIANVRPIANRGEVILTGPLVTEPWMGWFVDQRFFPIFSLLFGIGFSLLLGSAARRVARPRVVLLRRLVTLLGVGLLHRLLLWGGDILTVYALVGLLVLLPSSWLPRRAVLGLAAPLLVVPLIFGGGYMALVPGLFLLGSALTRYGALARLEQSARLPIALGLVLGVAAAGLLWLQERTGDPRAFGAAGLVTASVYVLVVLALLRSPLRGLLRSLFEPLGRMALTNYLTATVLVLAITSELPGRPESWPSADVLLIVGGILAVQWLWSVLWLRAYRQGPLEWLWRWVTWIRRPPLRRASADDAGASGNSGRRRESQGGRAMPVQVPHY